MSDLDRKEVLEIFAEASRGNHSIFADLPREGTGVEFAKRKKGRQPEDPLFVRLRSKRYRAANLEELRQKDRDNYHSDPELQARLAARKEELDEAVCKGCSNKVRWRSNLGPRPEYCSKRCSRLAREQAACKERQAARGEAAKGLKCQRCDAEIIRVGSRGRLPKFCDGCRELSRAHRLPK